MNAFIYPELRISNLVMTYEVCTDRVAGCLYYMLLVGPLQLTALEPKKKEVTTVFMML